MPQVLADFNVTDDIYITLIVSIWELGEGLGPFFVAPLSELYGRLPIYHAGNILFILCMMASAMSTNLSMLLAFRFLSGFVVSSSTLGPSMTGDLFRKEERGMAMSIAMSIPLIGPFAAPVIGGFIAQAGGWRWTIWFVTIVVGAVSGLSVLLFRETYKAKILERKTRRLRAQTGNDLLRSRHEDAMNKDSFVQSMLRPAKMLFCSPIVSIVSFYTALTYGVSYLILTTLTVLVKDVYQFSTGAAGLAFLGRGRSITFLVSGILKFLSRGKRCRYASVWHDL